MRILLLNQCFYPDVVSTAQHLTDLATDLSARGHDVTVLTGDRGYDNPSLHFQRKEWNGITILRIRSLSLGKNSKWRRGLNFGSFLMICALRLLFLRRFDVVVALTSPPLISFLAALFVRLKGGRLCLWVMDLNPDEAIAAGWLKSKSWSTWLLQRMLNYSLQAAERIVVLDRFVKERILQRNIDSSQISIIPPWSHSDVVGYSAEGRAAFRAQHQLSDKFIVMYSGNHSPCHPLDTLLEAALQLRTREEIAFCFIGGGSEQAKVREFAALHRLTNIKSLPYQPLECLSDSLSSADMQVVVMGNAFVGIIHPCKIYNIMTIGTPVLYIGPSTSHITDLANEFPTDHFFSTPHGDHMRVVDHILECAQRTGDGGGDVATWRRGDGATGRRGDGAKRERNLPISPSPPPPVSGFSPLRESRNAGESADRSAHSKEVLLPQLCALFEPAGFSFPATISSSVMSVTNNSNRKCKKLLRPGGKFS